MSKHLYRDVDFVHRKILELSALVEEMIDRALQAFEQRDNQAAAELVQSDAVVDQQEVKSRKNA